MSVQNEGRGQAQRCVHGAGMPGRVYIRNTSTINVIVKKVKKFPETEHAEPIETACRAHFQMQVPRYVKDAKPSRVSNIVTTFIGQKKRKRTKALP